MEEVYTNVNGVKFKIIGLPEKVPEDADYFGFTVISLVLRTEEPITNHYKALVKKSICPTENSAEKWLNTIGKDFLHEILDTYEEEQTLMLFPNNNGDWYIL